MTTLDRVVASDLASLARDGAYRAPTVNASLAIVEAKRVKPPRAIEEVTDPARAYAVRLARLAGLAMAVASSTLAVAMHRAGILDPDKMFLDGYAKEGRFRGFPRIGFDYSVPSYRDWHYAVVAVVALIAISYLIANAIALRTADRRIPPDPSVLPARVGAARLGRLVTGGAGLLGIIAILLIATNLLGLRSPNSCSDNDGCLDPIVLEPVLIGFAILALMLSAKMIATELASGGWARRPSTWLDASSTVVAVTSFTALPTLFGILGFTAGSCWIDFLEHFDGNETYADLGFVEKLWREEVARDVELVTLVIFVVAAAIGVACAREARLGRPSRCLRTLESPLMFGLALVIGTATLWSGVHAASVRYYGRATNLEPWQIALMVAGGAAVFLVVSMTILRRRRAEHARATTPPPQGELSPRRKDADPTFR